MTREKNKHDIWRVALDHYCVNLLTKKIHVSLNNVSKSVNVWKKCIRRDNEKEIKYILWIHLRTQDIYNFFVII